MQKRELMGAGSRKSGVRSQEKDFPLFRSSFCLRQLLTFLSLAFFFWFQDPAFADTTGDVRPTADGGTEQWQNNANTACSSATCYTEVNEASGANCSTAPGDGTYNHSTTTNNQIQFYDLDESSIPDNATLGSVVVSGCLQRGGSQNVNGRFKVSIDGNATDCSTTFTATSAWQDFNCTIDFPDVTKNGTTDFEIGLQNTQARDLRLTAIKANITYTPPASGPNVNQMLISEKGHSDTETQRSKKLKSFAVSAALREAIQ